MTVTVPSGFWIGSSSPIVCPAANTITDLPLSAAVNTCRNVPVPRKMPSA